MRRPVASFLAAAVVLLVMASPVLDLRTANTSLSQLPRGEAVVQGSNELQRAVTGPGQGAVGAVGVLATPRPGESAALDPAAGRGARRPHRARPGHHRPRRSRCSPSAASVEIVAPLRIDAEGDDGRQQARPADPRALVARLAAHAVATTAVGGDSAFQRDLNEEVGERPAAGDRGAARARLPRARRHAALARAAAQGGAHEPALDQRLLRRAGRRLRVGLGRLDGLPSPRDDRHADAAARARDHVRALDGLRGVPALAHPRALPAARRHPPRGGARASRRRRG